MRCIAVAHFSANATAGVADATKWGLFELTFSVDCTIYGEGGGVGEWRGGLVQGEWGREGEGFITQHAMNGSVVRGRRIADYGKMCQVTLHVAVT